MSLRLPQFANKDFIPSSIQSISVTTRPLSPEWRTSTTCIDLDAFALEVSGSSFGYRLVSIVEKGSVSSCSVTSSEDEQADMSTVLSRFQPWNRPTSPVHISDSQIVLESPSHYETPDYAHSHFGAVRQCGTDVPYVYVVFCAIITQLGE